jgi:hypothetical protein
MSLLRRAALVVALAFVVVASSGTRSFANASELLRVVTYNVAGPPEGILRSSSIQNMPAKLRTPSS